MTDVYCADIECKYCKDYLCTADEINLASENILTQYNGRQKKWLCKTFEMSDIV